MSFVAKLSNNRLNRTKANWARLGRDWAGLYRDRRLFGMLSNIFAAKDAKADHQERPVGRECYELVQQVHHHFSCP